MSPLQILGAGGVASGELELTPGLAAQQIKPHLIHEVVTQELAARRGGNASTKTRSDVRGGGAKPWRQKGTGRARAGSNRSPLWSGGGVVFGPKPRDFSKKVSRSTRQLALRKALSERLRAGDVLLVNELKLESAKTKEFLGLLSALELKGSALFVAQAPDRNLTLASRNVRNVALTTSDALNTYDILHPDKLVFTTGAFEQVEARLNK